MRIILGCLAALFLFSWGPICGMAVTRIVSGRARRLWARTAMQVSAAEYFSHLGKRGWTFFVGGVGGVVGQLNDMRTNHVTIPAWAWSLIAIACFGAASFLAFHHVRKERDGKFRLIAIRTTIREHIEGTRLRLASIPGFGTIDMIQQGALDALPYVQETYDMLLEHNALWAQYYLPDGTDAIPYKAHYEAIQYFLEQRIQRLETLMNWD